jgi:hypothetical protein
MNCPFYGRSGARFPILLQSGGNQCALLVHSFSPCEMEMIGRAPDWKECELVKSFRREEEQCSS